MKEPITITDVRRRGLPDWFKPVILLIVGAALFGGAFYLGMRRGPVRTHTLIYCASGDLCRDYWSGP